MKNNTLQSIAGFCLISALTCSAGTVRADYSELLDTLEENKTITAGQAEELRGKAPTFSIHPSSKNIRDLAIRGRIHLQGAYVDADNDEGSDDFSTLELRRVRLGARGTLFDDFRAQVEANLVPGKDLSMRSAYIQWRAHKPAHIKAGYDKPRFSIEENTSSAEILTIERSLINNLLATGPLNGISLDGEYSLLQYGIGAYTDSDNRNEGGSEAEYLYNAMLGMDLGRLVGDGNALLVRGSWLASDDANGTLGENFDAVMTLGIAAGIGNFQIVGEYLMGDSDDGDTEGWYIMPSCYLTDTLQAVVKYEQAESDNAKGIRASSRYTRDVPSLSVRETGLADGSTTKVDPQRGDDYSALYMGVNYYFAGHSNKLMFGVELAELNGTDAGKLKTTTVSTAWRMLF